MLFLCRQKSHRKKNLPEDRTSYEWIGNTFALRTSFGSYDSYTTFADRTHKPHTLSSVIAIDSKTQCAVTADNKGVSFYSLFHEKPVKFISAKDKKIRLHPRCRHAGIRRRSRIQRQESPHDLYEQSRTQCLGRFRQSVCEIMCQI